MPSLARREPRGAGTRLSRADDLEAEHYFPRLGFACVGRDEVPERVQCSVEFTCACPASAVAMQKRLDETQ